MRARRSTPFSGSSKRAIMRLARTMASRQMILRTRTRPLRRVRLRLHGRPNALCLRAHGHRTLHRPNRIGGPQPESLRPDHRAVRSPIRSGVLGTYRSRRCGRRVDREKSERCKRPSSNGSRRTLRTFRSPSFTTDALVRIWVSAPLAFRFGFLCTGRRLKAPITRATVPFAVGSSGCGLHRPTSNSSERRVSKQRESANLQSSPSGSGIWARERS